MTSSNDFGFSESDKDIEYERDSDDRHWGVKKLDNIRIKNALNGELLLVFYLEMTKIRWQFNLIVGTSLKLFLCFWHGILWTICVEMQCVILRSS